MVLEKTARSGTNDLKFTFRANRRRTNLSVLCFSYRNCIIDKNARIGRNVVLMNTDVSHGVSIRVLYGSRVPVHRGVTIGQVGFRLF